MAVLTQIKNTKMAEYLDYIYYTLKGTSNVSPLIAYVCIYGVRFLSNVFDSSVYDFDADKDLKIDGSNKMIADLDINFNRLKNQDFQTML